LQPMQTVRNLCRPWWVSAPISGLCGSRHHLAAARCSVNMSSKIMSQRLLVDPG
jgi:hypothetical protein